MFSIKLSWHYLKIIRTLPGMLSGILSIDGGLYNWCLFLFANKLDIQNRNMNNPTVDYIYCIY